MSTSLDLCDSLGFSRFFAPFLSTIQVNLNKKIMSEKCDSTDWLDIANKMFPYSYLKEAIFWALF